jgi:hypothetical protein
METNLSMREMFEREIAAIERKIEISAEVIDAKTKELINLKRELNTKLRAKAMFLGEKLVLRKSKKKVKPISSEKANQMLDQDIKQLQGKI